MTDHCRPSCYLYMKYYVNVNLFIHCTCTCACIFVHVSISVILCFNVSLMRYHEIHHVPCQIRYIIIMSRSITVYHILRGTDITSLLCLEIQKQNSASATKDLWVSLNLLLCIDLSNVCIFIYPLI